MQYTIDPASGGWRAHLWSGGKLIWWTEVYVNVAGAENAIRIAKASSSAPVTKRLRKAA